MSVPQTANSSICTRPILLGFPPICHLAQQSPSIIISQLHMGFHLAHTSQTQTLVILTVIQTSNIIMLYLRHLSNRIHCRLLGILLHQPMFLSTAIPVSQATLYLAQRPIAGELNRNIKGCRRLLMSRRPLNHPLPDTPHNNILQHNLNTIVHINPPWEGNREQTLT